MRRTLAFVFTAMTVLTASGVRAQQSMLLVDIKPVSGRVRSFQEKCSITGKIMNNFIRGGGFIAHESQLAAGFAVYDLERKYTTFRGWIGIPDDIKDARDHPYKIVIDGKTAMSGEVSLGDDPVEVNLDITGVQSLRIDLGPKVHLGDATLYKRPTGASGAVTPAPRQASGVVLLLLPQDGLRVTADSILLQWARKDGAVAYGVEIVCTKLSASNNGNDNRLWSFNVKDGAASCRFDLTSVPNGEYRWSVIAFSSSGVMGKFSKDRGFIVDR